MNENSNKRQRAEDTPEHHSTSQHILTNTSTLSMIQAVPSRSEREQSGSNDSRKLTSSFKNNHRKDVAVKMSDKRHNTHSTNDTSHNIRERKVGHSSSHSLPGATVDTSSFSSLPLGNSNDSTSSIARPSHQNTGSHSYNTYNTNFPPSHPIASGIEPQNVVVLTFGSSVIRLGLALQESPVDIPLLVAVRTIPISTAPSLATLDSSDSCSSFPSVCLCKEDKTGSRHGFCDFCTRLGVTPEMWLHWRQKHRLPGRPMTSFQPCSAGEDSSLSDKSSPAALNISRANFQPHEFNMLQSPIVSTFTHEMQTIRTKYVNTIREKVKNSRSGKLNKAANSDEKNEQGKDEHDKNEHGKEVSLQKNGSGLTTTTGNSENDVKNGRYSNILDSTHCNVEISHANSSDYSAGSSHYSFQVGFSPFSPFSPSHLSASSSSAVPTKPVYTGAEALWATDFAPLYASVPPISRGQFRDEPSISLRESISLFIQAVDDALVTHLKLNRTTRTTQKMCLAIAIPSSLKGRQIKVLLDALLEPSCNSGGLGFSAVWVMPQSVAAALAFGKSTAVVADMGAETSSIDLILDGQQIFLPKDNVVVEDDSEERVEIEENCDGLKLGRLSPLLPKPQPSYQSLFSPLWEFLRPFDSKQGGDTSDKLLLDQVQERDRVQDENKHNIFAEERNGSLAVPLVSETNLDDSLRGDSSRPEAVPSYIPYQVYHSSPLFRILPTSVFSRSLPRLVHSHFLPSSSFCIGVGGADITASFAYLHCALENSFGDLSTNFSSPSSSLLPKRVIADYCDSFNVISFLQRSPYLRHAMELNSIRENVCRFDPSTATVVTTMVGDSRLLFTATTERLHGGLSSASSRLLETASLDKINLVSLPFYSVSFLSSHSHSSSSLHSSSSSSLLSASVATNSPVFSCKLGMERFLAVTGIFETRLLGVLERFHHPHNSDPLFSPSGLRAYDSLCHLIPASSLALAAGISFTPLTPSFHAISPNTISSETKAQPITGITTTPLINSLVPDSQSTIETLWTSLSRVIGLPRLSQVPRKKAIEILSDRIGPYSLPAPITGPRSSLDLIGHATANYVGVHNAITLAVLSAPPELRQILASNVVLCGGVARTPFLVDEIEDRLIELLPVLDPVVGEVNVASDPHEADPATAVWRLLAKLSTTDSVRNQWIYSHEWEYFGVRLIRERTILNWISYW